jgi:ABC-type transport system involved in cytochrome c biogenesis permease component
MTLLPIIERELRAESRHPLTYWLRTLGAAALLAAALFFWFGGGFRERQGARLFAVLHQTLFWAIWILVPLLTADCISRERREGTLGLLFLTPLRARDIVVAKGLAHGLRGMTVVLAALPVVVVPFLMGGVDWRIATVSLLLDLTSFAWALSAGILASSRNRTLTGALCWSALWAFLLFWIMIWVCGFLFMNFVFSSRGVFTQFSPIVSYLAAGLTVVLSFFNMWQWSMSRVPPPANPVWLEVYGWVLAVSVFSLIALWLFAAWNIRHAWQDKPPSSRRQRIERRLFTPAFGLGFFRWWMRRTLERNPIGWLERRTWSARLVSWSWLAVMIAIYSWALGELGRGFGFRLVNELVPFLLVGSVALSAAGSFRRERELGVMELLLVTPLRVGHVIAGRLRGLWSQFLPAVILFVVIWWFLSAAIDPGQRWVAGHYGGWVPVWQLGICFIALPVIGLYFSLRCRHYLVAALMTLVTGLAVPYAFSRLFYMALERPGVGFPLESCSLLTWLAAGLALWGVCKHEDYRRLVWGAVAVIALPLVFAVVSGSRVEYEDTTFGSALRSFLQNFGITLMAASLQILLAVMAGLLLHRNLARRTFAFHA